MSAPQPNKLGGRHSRHGEDLSVYRVGELWVAGERPEWSDLERRYVGGARPKVIDVRPGLKHCVVLRANGQIEDPSKRLGMGGRG